MIPIRRARGFAIGGMASCMTSFRQGFTIGPGMAVEPALDRARAADFAFVELLLDGAFSRERIADREATEALADAFCSSDLDLVCHLPFALDIGSPFSPVREGSVAELLVCLDLAERFGAEKAVVHPSTRAWDLGWRDADLEPLIIDSVRQVASAARERAIEPCIENVTSGPYSIDGFDSLLDALDPATAMTFDTGHARLAGFSATESASFLDRHRDRVSHVHLSDNRGSGDEHLPVGLGTIDFETVLAPLFDGDWAGTMTHEVGTTDYEYIEASKRALDRL
jgi:sugar phosphate isomerase/epimerase